MRVKLNTGGFVKVLVSIKRVIDYKTHIRIKSDQSGVETANVKMSMNPFDEIAMEEAVRLKEKGIVTEVIAISIGGSAVQETLRTALAFGADRAILIDANQDVQPLVVAKILKAIALQEAPDLILLGKQAIDDDNNQTGQMLAGLLNWPQATFVSSLEIADNKVIAVREIDGGLQTIITTLPAVITTDLRLNEPRYLSLPNIVQAKRKPLSIIPIVDVISDTQSRLTVLKVTSPSQRKAGIKVSSVTELISKLKNEARVI